MTGTMEALVVPHRLLVVVDPRLLPSWDRLRLPRRNIRRAEWRSCSGRMPRSRRALALEIPSRELERLRHDPAVQGLRPVEGPDGGARVSAGELQEGWVRVRVARRPSELRLLEPIDLPVRPHRRRSPQWKPAARALAPARSTSRVAEMRWRPSRIAGTSQRQIPAGRRSPGRRPPIAADAYWVPDSVLARFLEALRRSDISWDDVVTCRVASGHVVRGVRRLCRPPPGVVPLQSHRAGAAVLYAESGLAVSPTVLAGIAPADSVWVAVVANGEACARRARALWRDASKLVGHEARKESVARARRPESDRGPRREGGLLVDARSASDARRVTSWLHRQGPEGGSREVRDRLREAFASGVPRAPGAQRTSRARGGDGWRRHFSRARLPAPLRAHLLARALARLRDSRERRRIVLRQERALSFLLERLSGSAWEEAIGLALPLRSPTEKEPKTLWINVEADLPDTTGRFSLELAALKGAAGVIGVGPVLYRQFEALYRQAGERLLAARDHRRAAHVFSYLLGDHVRAGAILEQGGFPREAATVYFHLARKPRRAAVALERGSLPGEAARLWMDLGLWRRAAAAWEEADDGVQARAAWRKLAADLRSRGRILAAAEVLESRLDDGAAALELLEHRALAGAPDSTAALERAIGCARRIGDVARGRSLAERALEEAREDVRRCPARRQSLKRMMELADRFAWWAASEAPDRVVSPLDARRAWLAALGAWASVRAGVPVALARELDGFLRSAATGLGTLELDPFLVGDLERWLRRLPLRDPPQAVTGSITEHRVSATATALAVTEKDVFVATGEGRISRYRRRGRHLEPVEQALETGRGRPIRGLRVVGRDLYSAAGEEVHHFELDDLTPRPRVLRPVQIERSLAHQVEDVLAVPDGDFVLRATPQGVHLLHGTHLLPVGVLPSLGDSTVASVAVNRHHVAALTHCGREPEAEDARFTVVVFHRRSRGGRLPFQPRERLEVDLPHPRRVQFFARDTDALLIVGDEHLALFPSRRELGTCHELSIGSLGRRLQPARVAGLPDASRVLVAYGDGSLEVIELDTRRRQFLVEQAEPFGASLVDFALTTRPLEAWLLDRAGRLRSIALGGHAKTRGHDT